ncbi:MAG TPA: GatB/YqeY domain-containing protein [Candidatus Limnocylindrales bacterium]|nr:GatB/YqeY domain-containing protein [Candidatus Limnocylindrales bacterium]
MSLRERIQEDTTAAMRSGDTLRRDVLRMASNAAYNLEKQHLRELTEDELIGVLTREVKQRRESIDAYRAGGRDDLASREEAELEILTEYLPEPLTSEQIDQLVAEGIAATGSASPRDLGKVMGWLASRTRGRADGKVVSQKVAAALAAPVEQGG